MTMKTGSGHRLGPVEQIPLGEGRAFVVDGEQVAVFRTRAGELRATDAVCPHASGPLADGQIDQRRVVCPLHGHVFTLADGSCATGDFAVRTYPVWEDDGQVVLELPTGSPVGQRPSVAQRTG
jgi:nitrite reductase/ring-hydroxylating ferredoxin subunit